MLIIKYIFLFFVILCCSYIGILISKRYLNRVRDLKQVKTALSIFSTKIKFTYEPIPSIFKEISMKTNEGVGNIFLNASNKMKNLPAGKAWEEALEEQQTNFIKDDIETLRNLSNLLGKVDIEGQVSEIELVDKFLDYQIALAEENQKKYVKLCKTLGIVAGFVIVIIIM